MNFPNEEARVKAMEELGDDPKNMDKLNEIRDATIGQEPPAPTSEKQPVKPAEEILKTPETPSKPPDVPVVDYAGHKNLDDLIKSHKELEATLERQGKKMREILEQQPQIDPNLVEKANRLEHELAELKKQSPGQPAKSTTKDIKSVRTELAAIAAELDQLDAMVEKDNEVLVDPGYQNKIRSLTRLQTQKMNDLTDLFEQAKSDIDNTKRFAEEYAESQKQTQHQEKINEETQHLYEMVNSLGDEEYKLPKPVEEIEPEYVEWRKSVALAYFGKPAKSDKEEFMALEQLQIKNPELIQKCMTMGIKTEPTDEIKKYLKNVELLDYMDGYRKDPVTGKVTRITRHDPVTNQEVPIVCKDLKTALKQKRLEDGYYDKKSESSYQQGAQDVANVAMRRDKGAVTLDAGADMGQLVNDAQWAEKILLESDPEVVMHEHLKGNDAKLNEIQKARAILKMEPITFEK